MCPRALCLGAGGPFCSVGADDAMHNAEINPIHILDGPPELTEISAREHWREINLLFHSVALLGDELDANRPLLPLLRASTTVVPADRGLLYQWDEVRFGLVLAASLSPADSVATSLASGNIQANACLLHRKPVMVSTPVDQPLREEMRKLGTEAVLSVPMTHHGMPWGVLQLMRDRPFSRSEAILIWMFALVLEGVLPSMVGPRSHRETVSSIDERTGLLTPDHFRKRLAWELRRASWMDRTVSVVSVKAEMFQSNRGGGMIPKTLRDASQVILRTIRQQDSVTCLDGHQFVIALPDTAATAALAVAEVVREEFFECAAGTIPIHDINIGCATYPEDGLLEDELIRIARTPVARGVETRG